MLQLIMYGAQDVIFKKKEEKQTKKIKDEDIYTDFIPAFAEGIDTKPKIKKKKSQLKP